MKQHQSRLEKTPPEAQMNFYKLVCSSHSGCGPAPPSEQTLLKPDDVPGHLCKVMLRARLCQLKLNITFGF